MCTHYRVIVTLTIVALSVYVSGCGESATVASNVLEQPKTRWLEGNPCAPPCWENIQPGVTQPEDVTEMLKASPIVDPESIHMTKVPENGEGLIVWTFSSTNALWSGRIGRFSKPGTVQVITLTTPDVCLGEIY